VTISAMPMSRTSIARCAVKNYWTPVRIARPGLSCPMHLFAKFAVNGIRAKLINNENLCFTNNHSVESIIKNEE
jgi:hypothetical protein